MYANGVTHKEGRDQDRGAMSIVRIFRSLGASGYAQSEPINKLNEVD